MIDEGEAVMHAKRSEQDDATNQAAPHRRPAAPGADVLRHVAARGIRPAHLVALQRSAGNAATARLLVQRDTDVTAQRLRLPGIIGKPLNLAYRGLIWAPRKIQLMIQGLKDNHDRADARDQADQLQAAIANLPAGPQRNQLSAQLHEAQVHGGMINI